MRKFSYLLTLATVVLLASCTQPFKKATDGTEYKIISGKGKIVEAGNIMELNAVIKYQDSTMYNSFEDGMPQFQPYDTVNFPPLFKEIFKKVHVGDSVIIKISTDSLIAKGQNAPFMKKGHYIIQSYTITNAYATQAEAEKAREAAQPIAMEKARKKSDEQYKKDDKTLTDYFAKNNIKVTKGKEGTYVEMIQPGAGPLIDSNIVVAVYYTGKNMKGERFDGNQDSTNINKEPLLVNLTEDPSLGINVIPGWKDGLRLLNKGAKAKLYIPSTLGYGPQAQSEALGANEILVFDIEVADIISREQAKIEADNKSKKMLEMRQKYMDSVKRATTKK